MPFSRAQAYEPQDRKVLSHSDKGTDCAVDGVRSWKQSVSEEKLLKVGHRGAR